MGSARLLLAVALALAITTDADATLSTLTLSPDAGSLITTRDNSVNAPPTTVIGSAESDKAKATRPPATEPPTTTAPPPPPIESDSTSTSHSDSTSKSDSEEQETTDPPATLSPGSTSDPGTNDSEAQTDATTKASASTSTSSKSSTATVDSLNDNTGVLSSGKSSDITTVLPIVFGALACVGAIVMAVTYKRKRDTNGDNDNHPSSDCEYTIGANFTPENRGLSPVREDKTSNVNHGTSASSAIADFTETNSSVSSSSPFGSTYSKVRVSSPVANYNSNSEHNMEFQDTCPRHERGSNVVLTFNEVPTESRRGAPQVQL